MPRTFCAAALAICFLTIPVQAQEWPSSSDVQHVGAWSDAFADAGVGEVRAIGLHEEDLYVAGSFEHVGGVDGTKGIARWDGEAWHALGTGVEGTISAIEIAEDGTVYVGGRFEEVGGVATVNVARWDGQMWHALGNGLEEITVRALALRGDILYVGGTRSRSVLGRYSTHLAKWDGSAWSGVGGEFNGAVFALEMHDGVLYAGGAFTDIGGVEADRAARWDGVSWEAVAGAPLAAKSTVTSIALKGESIYLGQLGPVPGTPGERLVHWDGSAWHALGLYTFLGVYDLEFVGDDLYVAGKFNNIPGTSGNSAKETAGFARWDGAAWHNVDGGVAPELPYLPQVEALVADGKGGLYIGGRFDGEGLALGADGLAYWDGDAWATVAPPGDGLRRPVNAIAVDGTDVYVGGGFLNAGVVQEADHIARWDGAAWHALGDGLRGEVHAMLSYDGDLYVGGDFEDAGGLADADHLARWDGAAWHAVGGGLDAAVYALAEQDGDLVVGGEFRAIADAPGTKALARWDGNAWHEYGEGFRATPDQFATTVYALLPDGDDLYIGGNFENVAGLDDTVDLARWDGSAWYAVGGGLFDHWINYRKVDALAKLGDDLYVGGDFDSPSPYYIYGLARWDGTTWERVPEFPLEEVKAMFTHDERLYVGGQPRNTPGHFGGLFAWDGKAWNTIGERQVDGQVSGLAIAGDRLYVGGDFSALRGEDVLYSHNVAIYTDPTLVATEPDPRPKEGAAVLSVPYPHPASWSATFSLHVERAQAVRVTVYDLLGKAVALAYDGYATPGKATDIAVATDALSPGTYVVRAVGETGRATQMLVVAR